jgi:hypothetical protein
MTSPTPNEPHHPDPVQEGANEAPRTRGGQPGNTNALVHGFYSPRFRETDLADLDQCQFSGLEDEIIMLRVYIRRVIDLSPEIEKLDAAISLLRALSLASIAMTRLIRTQQSIGPSPLDELSAALSEALQELDDPIDRTSRGLAADPPPGAANETGIQTQGV